MDVRSFLTRFAVFHWWLRRPQAFGWRVLRALRQRKVLPRYREWLSTQGMAKNCVSLATGPRFTVAMSVFRVSEGVLRETLASILRQTYPNFEFLVLDDASPEAHVRRVLQQASSGDSRIRLLQNTSRAGISEAANRLVREAQGEYVVFLDHDDTVPPHALAVVAAAVGQWPDVDWFFSDEDKLDSRGMPMDPCFKLGFSSHLALSWNFMAHLRVVRREKILTLGGHRQQQEGAQDWDLALRFLASGGRFKLIPQVLYHWRKVSGSMAQGSPAKAFANPAAEKAIREALCALLPGCEPHVQPLVPGASQFTAWWQAPSDLSVTVIASQKLPSRKWSRPHEVLVVSDSCDAAALEACLHKAKYDVVMVFPPEGLALEAMEHLVARLLIPGTAAAGARWVRGGRVLGSGFLVTPQGDWLDPLARLALNDPGYCNLTWLPQPRAVLLPWGFAAWRHLIQEGWNSVPEVPSPWRLTVGLAKLGSECVVIPEATFASAPPPLPGTLPVLPPLPYVWRPELGFFGLCP